MGWFAFPQDLRSEVPGNAALAALPSEGSGVHEGSLPPSSPTLLGQTAARYVKLRLVCVGAHPPVSPSLLASSSS